MQKQTINFSSENFTGAHPAIMQAVIAANEGNAPSYGNDVYTATAIAQLKKHFGDAIEVYFTFNGTGANNMALAAVTQPHQAIFCSDVAHLYMNESTAPETFTSCRLYGVQSLNGKINADALQRKINQCKGIHFPQPGVVSITQPTECGTVYSLNEIAAIKKICAANNLLLHVDGARFFTAAACLDVSLKDSAFHIDALTLGGTKNGMLFGEAVIFFNSHQQDNHLFTLKRSMQLASKNRFIAAQFTALLEDGLWYDIARRCHTLALHFQQQLQLITGIAALYPVDANAVFIALPQKIQLILQQCCHFYVWDESNDLCRFMFSFNNTMEEIDEVMECLKKK
ncbi:MAG: aminotransferase class I/II-fold pyridoxal phosphate-dependent enzyme [Bacteroidetes bacterium]|nr:aminotransferase class I/II-fold pyridoxal phosphate-dependent enzyme [Bacteroidota bacterium]